ncbi:sensor histidine kinase [Ornithinimicrobium faecis]|uniref:sensor histidine kinase n=1 Tax=Ornithinimicrobium faecis TaxID=2934158 RepID=UPI0021178708|nr:HAMP domain-containing sensor histidine kinase [Ornithinimicrobium sp. HY1745]
MNWVRAFLAPLMGVIVAAALVLWLWVPDLRIVVRVGLPVLVLWLGLVLVAAVLITRAVRRRLRRAEERGRRWALEEAQSEHRLFVARLDHELKNPLAALSLAVTNLQQGPADLATDRTLAGVRTQVDRLTRLVSDLRKVNDLSAAELERERVDLIEVLREVTMTLAEVPAYGDRSVELSVHEAPWPVGPVDGDRELLFVAFYNVVLNALKYSTDGPVHVHARSDGVNVTIEVSDTGIGVPAADQEAMWQELSRGGNVGHVAGSGLGLPLVATIVDLHRGSVGARSQEGVGTRVEVSLPLAD